MTVSEICQYINLNTQKKNPHTQLYLRCALLTQNSEFFISESKHHVNLKKGFIYLSDNDIPHKLLHLALCSDLLFQHTKRLEIALLAELGNNVLNILFSN